MPSATLESAPERPLPLAMRADLESRPQRFAGKRYWAVKDPLSLRYFHLGQEEYVVLTLLDGRTSLEQLRAHCEEAFAPRRFSPAELHGFIASLHRKGLLVAHAPGQGGQLLTRHREQRRRQWSQSLSSLLAIRTPGIHPGKLLDGLVPLASWFFSWPAVLVNLLVAASAVVLLLVHWQAFQSRLPDFETFLSTSNLPWLALSLAAIKILHELGHAVCCRRYGGDCHELGLMLLVFTPTLYCNVSDSWMLDGKWRRIAIAAAGIYVELVLAAAATWLWWFSQPGLFNALCLNVMVLCSLGTLLINGNPLLRYDGYFILSDLVEVPNLHARASAALRGILARACLGIELPTTFRETLRSRLLLAGFAVAALAYRAFVVVAVLWALGLLARPYGLRPLVAALAGFVVVGMIWPLAAGAASFVKKPVPGRRYAPLRLVASGLFVALAIGAMALVPVASRIEAPLVLEYRDAEPVYATMPGTLIWAAEPGAQVQAGDPVARLRDPALELELAQLTNQRDRQQQFVATLEAQRLQGLIDGAQLPAAKAALADAQARLEHLQRDAARLTLTASRAGAVLPPPYLPPQPLDETALATWSGTPLDARNRGSHLETGTLVCLVGDARRFEAVLHVDEHDVEFVAPGQRVELVLDHLPGQVLSGEIVDLAKRELDVMPRELAATGRMAARTDAQGHSRPLHSWYQARVWFDIEPQPALARVSGRAKIDVASRTLGAQLLRALKQTFAQ